MERLTTLKRESLTGGEDLYYTFKYVLDVYTKITATEYNTLLDKAKRQRDINWTTTMGYKNTYITIN